MRRRVLLSVILVMSFATAQRAEARRRKKSSPQQHEVRLEFDIAIAQEANASFFDAQYSFLPVPLQSEDEVVPALRRFVRHPSEVYLKVAREGSTVDTRSSASLGTRIHVLDGLLHFGAQAGFELDDVRYDASEGEYSTTPLAAELGVRPHPLVSLTAYGKLRPIVNSNGSGIAGFSTTRDGSEWEAGGIVTAATPNDALLVSASLGWHAADWEFDGVVPESRSTDGEMTVAGLRATLLFSWQSSATFSWIVRASGSRELWDNNRDNQAVFGLEAPFEATVLSLIADAGLVYWYDNRLGFRFTLGGGHEGERPHVNGRSRSQVRFGFGLSSRF